jgi:hypothetical protein
MLPLAKVNAIMPATETHIVLALATLGNATQIGLFLFIRRYAQGTKASK